MTETSTPENEFGIGGALIFAFFATILLSVFGLLIGLYVISMSHEDAVKEIQRLRTLVPTEPQPVLPNTA